MKKPIVLLFVSLLICGLWPIAKNSKVYGLAGSEFKAGRIIDDGIFFNQSGMSITAIQNFLNTKVPDCDTDGSQAYAGTTRAAYGTSKGYPPPYTCLKDYSMTTVAKSAEAGLCNGYSAVNQSAAEIIYGVSQSCGVSAKVLLILLQKEQSLVTDDWPWSVQYRSATGYGCPDTAPCDAQYYGFFNQVYAAARQYKNYYKNPSYYNYKANQNNHILYNPNSACGGSSVYISNQATAGLYNYTPYQPNTAALNNLYGTGDSCSAYGNRNFWRMYNDWFGTTYMVANDCDSKVTNVSCVWSLMKSDGSQFLTSSKYERDYTINNYGWAYEGVAFYASPTQTSSSVPTYRLRQGGKYYYTIDSTEYTNLKNSGSWIDEGIAFYAYQSTTSTNISHPIYKLYNSTLGRRYWTVDENKKISLLNMGYTLEATAFNSFSGFVKTSIPAVGRLNIYRVQGINSYFYSTNLNEIENTIKTGFIYEGVMTSANSSNSGTAVYRLQSNGRHFYTSNPYEKSLAISKFGMIDEGIAFYLDSSSAQIYRLSNSISGKYLYTSSIHEMMSVANTNGWVYENSLNEKVLAQYPVYRFINLFNNRHFYTINMNEATKINNKGWKFETIAFSANKNSGQPVYRLLSFDKHFFTNNSTEKDIAVTKFGYIYEGIGFYGSSSVTSKPVYRLQGGNDEYFLTASGKEKDDAVSKYGYIYEGIAFYLP